MLIRLFTEHPESVGETYFEHVGVAISFSMKMFFGAMVCLVHAVMPFLFVNTGSKLITELHDKMVTNRSSDVDKAAGSVSEGRA